MDQEIQFWVTKTKTRNKEKQETNRRKGNEIKNEIEKKREKNKSEINPLIERKKKGLLGNGPRNLVLGKQKIKRNTFLLIHLFY